MFYQHQSIFQKIMTINNTYIQEYASKFTAKICEDYFSQRKYMTGPQLVQLTPSIQVNFFAIKSLFDAWRLELEKLKSNPYFDYRDNAVHEALREFMNVLSRSIKIERKDFEPLLETAVAESIQLALDPVAYFEKAFETIEPTQLNTYLKENKKYFKWHTDLIQNLIDRAGLAYTKKAFKDALNQNFAKFNDKLEPAESLLRSMNTVYPLDLTKLIAPLPEVEQEPGKETDTANEQTVLSSETVEKTLEEKPVEQPPKPSVPKPVIALDRSYKYPTVEEALDPLQIWSKFESEEYSIMKGTIKDLTESVGINQKFMFTKALFHGNPDLLNHALKSIDQCENFIEAIELLNQRYVGELNWDKGSDEVNELLQLIFRKFDDRS